ncbi:MAG: hypothetical protein ABI877_10920, partial [Gemmatimonadaceae bacterium]
MKASLQHRFEYGALRAVLGLFALFPFSFARRFGEALGVIGYWPLGIRRRVVTRQIAAAFPGLEPRGVTQLARGAYRSLGRTTIESALVSRLGSEGVLSLFEST